MTMQVLAIALSQAAFGAVTLMFIAYSTVVANKVDERDPSRERKQARKIRKAEIIGVPEPVCYVYEGTKAENLSRTLRQTSTVLACTYVLFFCLSMLMIAPKWLSWSFVQSTAKALCDYGFSPHDPATLYTLLVVFLAWWLKRSCDTFFACGRAWSS